MKKILIIIITIVVIGTSIFLLPKVNVNYDMKRYLPQDNELVQGINLHDDLYGTSSYTFLLLENTSLSDALDAKQQLVAIDHVSNIMFIDDILNEQVYHSQKLFIRL